MKIETTENGKVRINGVDTGCVSVREARRKMPGLFEDHCGVCNVRESLHDAALGHTFTVHHAGCLDECAHWQAAMRGER